MTEYWTLLEFEGPIFRLAMFRVPRWYLTWMAVTRVVGGCDE